MVEQPAHHTAEEVHKHHARRLHGAPSVAGTRGLFCPIFACPDFLCRSVSRLIWTGWNQGAIGLAVRQNQNGSLIVSLVDPDRRCRLGRRPDWGCVYWRSMESRLSSAGSGQPGFGRQDRRSGHDYRPDRQRCSTPVSLVLCRRVPAIAREIAFIRPLPCYLQYRVQLPACAGCHSIQPAWYFSAVPMTGWSSWWLLP